MDFENTLNDTHCECLENAKEDYKNEYCRVLTKSTLKEKDFLTYLERNRTPNYEGCVYECGIRSISVDKIDDSSAFEKIKEIHKITYMNSPKLKKYLLKFKLKENAGLLEHTPNSENGNNYHHNFYKSDSFTIDLIEQIETHEFSLRD